MNLEEIQNAYPEEYRAIQELLNKLDFVEWDRFTVDGNTLNVYGWIARAKDSYKDFVLVNADLKEDYLSFFTSSAEYDPQIYSLLMGMDEDAEHNPCLRVEHHLPEIQNSIKL